MTYSWLTELISIGYSKATKGDKKGLQAEDVKNVKARDKTSNRFAEFIFTFFRTNSDNMD